MIAPSHAYVVGSGLAGLAASVELAGQGVTVALHEAAPRSGGRCRSYFDKQLGQVIDNGNHFVFSGNQAVNWLCDTLGTRDKLEGPDHADFAFHDLVDGSRWTMRVNDSPFAWWVFDKSRRAPGCSVKDHLALAKLIFARDAGQTIGDAIADRGLFWRRMAEPMMLAVLNCAPEQGSSLLAGRFLRESFVRGGRACRTMVAMPTLDAVFIDPALDWLKLKRARAHFSSRLKGLRFAGDQVVGLDFGDRCEEVHDRPVILAVPPWVAASLVPDLDAPDQFCSILNAHFAMPAPAGAPPITALLGATSQWVVCHGDRISVTISGADDIIDQDRDALIQTIWREVSATLGLTAAMPAWQIVKEKRATFAATPEQNAKRPLAKTRWRNLFLAGDWVQTGLPATIEGALRSGRNAASLALGHSLVY